jgi:hypothetical protein
MTQQELSALALELEQLESERAQIEERAAHIGVALMESYPAGERPELVSVLLENIDNLI